MVRGRAKLGRMTEAPAIAGRNLGERLRSARRARHLTLVQVGELVGVTHAAIGQWERNLTLPDVANLTAVAEHYGVGLDWLVWGGDTLGSGLEARVRRIHPTLRSGLVERLHREIDQTEEAAKRLPAALLGSAVSDNDTRLAPWRAPKPVKKGQT